MHRVVWFVSTLQANARIYLFISFLICPLNLVSSQIVHVQYVTYWCISEEMAQLSYLRMYLVVYCLPTFSFVSPMLRSSYFTQHSQMLYIIQIWDINIDERHHSLYQYRSISYSYSSLSITLLKQLNGSVSTHVCQLRFRASVKKKDGVDVYMFRRYNNTYLVIKGLNVRHSFAKN